MIMPSNLEKILPLLRFDLGTHHVQIIRRSKDGGDIASRQIAEWYLSSQDKLQYLMPGIITLCDLYDARCYINLAAKSNLDVSWAIGESIVKRLKANNCNPVALLSHCHDTVKSRGNNYWIIDVDDPDVDMNLLVLDINKCQSKTIGSNVVATVPTKNGYHIITIPFNLTQLTLPKFVEIKKDCPTLLYYT